MNKTAREIELEKKVAAGLRCEKIHLNRAFRAEKKLEIAVKALEKYADKKNWEDIENYDEYYVYAQFKPCGYEIAQKALKKIGFEK